MTPPVKASPIWLRDASEFEIRLDAVPSLTILALYLGKCTDDSKEETITTSEHHRRKELSEASFVKVL